MVTKAKDLKIEKNDRVLNIIDNSKFSGVEICVNGVFILIQTNYIDRKPEVTIMSENVKISDYSTNECITLKP